MLVSVLSVPHVQADTHTHARVHVLAKLCKKSSKRLSKNQQLLR